MDEAEEGAVGELDVPLGALPALGRIPPLAGKGKGTAGGGDGAGVRPVEEGERMGLPVTQLGGDVNFNCGAITFQWQCCVRDLRWAMGDGWCGRRDRRLQIERVGLVGIERDGGAEPAGAEEGIEPGEGVGKLVGVAEGTFEKVVLGFGGEGGEKLEVEDRDG